MQCNSPEFRFEAPGKWSRHDVELPNISPSQMFKSHWTAQPQDAPRFLRSVARVVGYQWKEAVDVSAVRHCSVIVLVTRLRSNHSPPGQDLHAYGQMRVSM